MKKIVMTFIFAAIFTGGTSLAFSMTISPMDTADGLAQYFLGTGIAISNISYTGASAASGYFTGGTDAGIGMETGIVLTSGHASNLNATSNTGYVFNPTSGTGGVSGVNNLDGDPALGPLTLDAAAFEFDFVSAGDAVYFNYVFGSEEYNEYVESGFDAFGFFVKNVNYAQIPGTTTPVSIRTVNNTVHAEYYNDNGPGPYAFEYDGFTDVFTANITGLTPGQTYHIRLAVADAMDYQLDSGVFLEAGTFSANVIPPDPAVPEPGTIFLLGIGLISLAGVIRRFRNAPNHSAEKQVCQSPVPGRMFTNKTF